MKRMTGEELAAIRAARGESQARFGAYIAQILGEDRAYRRQEVNAWENGPRPIPALVELALLRAALETLDLQGFSPAAPSARK